MQKITSVAELKEAIVLLEMMQAKQAIELKEHFHETCESLNPITLIKNTLLDATAGAKTGMADTAIGMTTGYLSKKILTVGTHNPILKLLGTLVEVGVAIFVSKHPEEIKSVGGRIIKYIFRKKEAV